MSIIQIQATENICENLGCVNQLGYYDIKKGTRFCKKCKSTSHTLEWKCRGCNNIISNSGYRETRLYCSSCR